eukprot:CAMPEP_0185321696 /NCGR_PEP_ID=MMETSP1363-20130426/57726_1 /TAXON_ID=38817 /ORGANISM="Gephyrocapsa oceanica, Strain RCC1303" /LENGTH=34 /DNA_ID= /DNA_START= /DNA_END= /DNA_ORIENTATION=
MRNPAAVDVDADQAVAVLGAVKGGGAADEALDLV